MTIAGGGGGGYGGGGSGGQASPKAGGGGAGGSIGPAGTTYAAAGAAGDGSITITWQEPVAPTVSGISPSTGPATGGNTITITGSNLTGATVTIGGQACTNVAVNGDGTSLTCTVPAGTAGAADVVVTANGESVTASQKYTFTSSTTKPNAPRNVKVKGRASAKAFTVAWKASLDPNGTAPVTSYRVKINQRGYSKIIVVKNVPSSKHSVKLTRKKLLAGSALTRGDVRSAIVYRVRVEAINPAGVSPVARTFFTIKL